MSYDIEKKNKMKRILLAFICTKFQLCGCKNAHFMAISLLPNKNIFSQKKTGIGKSRGIGATNQHEIVP